MANVEILRGTGMVTAEDVLGFGAAGIVLATGARWVGDGLGAMRPGRRCRGSTPPCPHCVTPEQFFAGKPVGERVVVLDADGYFMAISLAERLADAGQARHHRHPAREGGAHDRPDARGLQPAPA